MVARMGLRHDLAVDREANQHNTKGRFVVRAYRIGRYLKTAAETSSAARLVYWPYSLWYRLSVVWLLGIDLPLGVQAGPGLVIYHGVGLVVHEGCVLGSGVTLRQGCTLGTRKPGIPQLVPTVGDRVEFGAGCIVHIDDAS
jgi:serine acetyltransferase